MEFLKKMNSEIIYKKLSELEEGKEYEILDYDIKFVESLKKYILNVTINVDGLECSVGLPDKIRRRFDVLSRNEQDKIIGQKFKYDIKYIPKAYGEHHATTLCYNVRFIA
jgi:hypothetical protein